MLPVYEMQRRLKKFGILLLTGLASACASTPTSRPGAIDDAVQLSLCKGVRISNAPQTDSAGRIINFDAIANINGVSLLRAPVEACVSSGFGPRRGGASSFHHGVDLYTGGPKPIFAGGAGTVAAVESLRGYGKTVLVDHGRGVKTRYAHLSSYADGLSPGRRVAKGDRLGLTGRTGNATAVHLHYEILIDGRRHNPLTVGG